MCQNRPKLAAVWNPELSPAAAALEGYAAPAAAASALADQVWKWA